MREDGPEVAGFLFASAALPELWAALDDFEVPGYDRVLTRAWTDGGEVVDAWAYVDRAIYGHA